MQKSIAILSVALVASVLVIGTFASPAFAKDHKNEEKALICHVTIDEYGDVIMKTKSIGVDDVAEHLAHGDSEGICTDDSGVLVCHQSEEGEFTKSLDPDAVADHLSHGDTLGPCANS